MRDYYLRTGNGLLFVYSITSRSSFDKVAVLLQTSLLISHEDTLPMVLVGNKCDLEKYRQVSKEEGEELAQIYSNAHFLNLLLKTELI